MANTLAQQWEERQKLMHQSRLLIAYRIDEQAGEVYLMTAEIFRSRAEGYRLFAEANILWAEAVLAKFGDTVMEWKDGNCQLQNGETYRGETT